MLLASCGFQPLHGTGESYGETSAALRQVAVAPIPERIGQLLRIELGNRLNPDSVAVAPIYSLSVSVKESRRDLAVRKDATATRANLVIAATYELSDIKTQQALLKGTVRSINSYDILDADFATLSAEADARKRAARDLATEIRARLGAFLAQQTNR